MTAPEIPPTRADELEAGQRVMVSATTILTVEATRPGHHGDVDIRWICWVGSTQWASVPADREFIVVQEVAA